MNPKTKGTVLFVLALSFMILGNTNFITGNIVGGGAGFNISWLTYIGIVFLIASLVSSTKKSIDVIIIPSGGSDEINIRRAKKAYSVGGDKAHYSISGLYNNEEGEVGTIEAYLRGRGVKGIISEDRQARDTLENAVYSIIPHEGIERVGVVSNPSQIERIKYILKKAKEDGTLKRDVNITYIPTSETLKEKIYGWLASIKEKYRLRRGVKEEAEKIRRGEKRKKSWLTNLFKKIFGGS